MSMKCLRNSFYFLPPSEMFTRDTNAIWCVNGAKGECCLSKGFSTR